LFAAASCWLAQFTATFFNEEEIQQSSESHLEILLKIQQQKTIISPSFNFKGHVYFFYFWGGEL